MTRSPGERTAIENKQATPRLPHCEYNIDCNLLNLRKHLIMTVSALCTCIHRICVQSRNPVQVLRWILLYPTILVADTALSEIKLPNIKSKI